MLLATLLFAAAQPSDWPTGPLIDGHGPHAAVDVTMQVPEGTNLAHTFDAVDLTDTLESRTLQSAARFMNMHAAAGVDPADVRPAIVVHGPAAFALVDDARFGERHDGKVNPNAALVRALLDNGARIILCGQSAAGQDIANEDLLPGVEVALSAMTAHALLQREGYSLNPF